MKRQVVIVALVAMASLLVLGGVHRTQSVLAGEGRAAQSVEAQDRSPNGFGQGGRGGGDGQGRWGGGSGHGGGLQDGRQGGVDGY